MHMMLEVGGPERPPFFSTSEYALLSKVSVTLGALLYTSSGKYPSRPSLYLWSRACLSHVVMSNLPVLADHGEAERLL